MFMAQSTSQTAFLSSGQALDELVRQESHQRSISVKRWAATAAIGAGVAGASIYGLATTGASTSGIATNVLFPASLLGACFGIPTFLLGGVQFVVEKLGLKKGDGSTVYFSFFNEYESDLTNRPSLGNRMRGLSPVAPVESVEQLAQNDGGLVLMNGVHIYSAGGVYPSTIQLKGNFNSLPLTLLSEGGKHEAHLFAQKGKDLCVMGRVENVKEGVLSLCRYEPALVASTAGRPN